MASSFTLLEPAEGVEASVKVFYHEGFDRSAWLRVPTALKQAAEDKLREVFDEYRRQKNT